MKKKPKSLPSLFTKKLSTYFRVRQPSLQNNILKLVEIEIEKLETARLILIPYTITICENILSENFDLLSDKGFVKGKSWPDEDVIETIPKIIKNLLRNNYSTGFESWLIIKKDTKEIIGDIGFKGYNLESQNIDLGYGIISEERRNGYAEEAARQLINWALKFDFVNEITANCLNTNFQSINLLKKLNFSEVNENENTIYWSLKNMSTKLHTTLDFVHAIREVETISFS